VTDHGHLRAARKVLLRAEGPSLHDPRAKQAEIVCADLTGSKLFGELTSRVVHDIGAKRRGVLHHSRLLPPVCELGWRCRRAGACGEVFMEQHDRAESGKGTGLRRTALTTEKIAVLAPNAKASAATAAAVNARFFANIRNACFRSCRKSSTWTPGQPAAAPKRREVANRADLDTARGVLVGRSVARRSLAR